ncbi:hypothetical protein [Deinococcus pimensis]|uniref:hypothetical protein n=1 Tax=Deinococcus pimensis TaxID=309888 RepID=UPI0004B7E626|nr:hypothetical protein [Deinococcus pimensis]
MRDEAFDVETWKPTHAAARRAVAEAIMQTERHGEPDFKEMAGALRARLRRATFDVPRLRRIEGEAHWLVVTTWLDL